MRDSEFFELRLSRFGVWRLAVALVAGAAIAAVAAWAAAMLDSQGDAGRALVVGVAAGLALATIGLARSLAHVPRGVLSCRDGVWAFAPDIGAPRSGSLEVAMDLGVFLLLRLVDRGRTRLWLPLQRRGLEAHWHALRCAAYSPPPHPSAASGAPPRSPA